MELLIKALERVPFFEEKMEAIMAKKKRYRIYSFLLAVVMTISSFVSNVSVALAAEPETAEHGISVVETTGGVLTIADSLERAPAGTDVHLMAQAEEGYQLFKILVNEGEVPVEAVPEQEQEYHFIMPEMSVQIRAEFVQEPPKETAADTAAETANPEAASELPEGAIDTEKEGSAAVSEKEGTVSGNNAAETATEETATEEQDGELTEEAAQENKEAPTEGNPEEAKEESGEPVEKISGVYFEFQTLEEILELAENGMDLEEFFQYSIWGFLEAEDIRCLLENQMTLDDLYEILIGNTESESEEIGKMAAKYQERYMPRHKMSAFSARSTLASSTATASISGAVSDSALGTIPAFGSGDHGEMLRITLDGNSAFCAQYGAACRTGMTYTKVSGDEIGIDRSQQYLIYRIVGWYYDAQAINDNTANYAITQAAIWLVRNGQWGSAESMAAAIRPMLTKVTILDDATSISLFKAMADWVNNEANQPKVGIDFWYNGPNQYLVTVGGETYIETEDPEYSAYVKLYKTDSVTGAGLNGTAQFKIFTEDGIDTGATFSKSGSTYTSTPVIKDEEHSRFYVQEVGAPTGYLKDGGKYYFTIEDGDENAEKVITNNGSSFANNPYWVQITIPKTDSETGKMIANNAQFTVTAQSGSLSQAVTFTKQTDGSYLSSKIYYNESNRGQFYVQETKAPANYYGDWENEDAAKTAGSNSNKVKYSFTVDGSSHGKTLTITNNGNTFSNDRVKGTITVYKIDVEAEKYVAGDNAHGDASLDGAVYGLYARKDILYPDGVSGVKYPAGTLITEGTIENGQVTWEDLYLGSYYVKEISPGTGYLLDTKEYDVTLTYKDESVEIVMEETTVDEQVKKQAFQLLKLEGESLDEQYELSGAGFEVYLLSDLGIDAAGKSDEELINEVAEKYPDYENGLKDEALAKLYENDASQIDAYNATQTPLGSKGLTKIGDNWYQLNEIFTDATGRLTSPELPFGTYVVVETTVPKNTLIDIKPFIVHVDEDSRQVQYQRYFLDKDFEAKIKVVKTDADTGKTVLKAGVSYKIYDLTNQKYVQLPIVVDNKEEIKEVFTTTEEGYILTDLALPCGRYRIEEVQGPDGFYNEFVGTDGRLGSVEFEINTDQVYEMSDVSGDAIIEFKYYNRETRGELTIQKIGEQLVDAEHVPTGSILEALQGLAGPGSADVEFVYEKLPLAGAEYTIEAAEDIYTQDNQTEESGNRTLWFQEGETVAVVVTGEDGQIDNVKYPSGGYEQHPIVQVIHNGETGKVSIRLPLGSYRVFESKAPYGFLHTDEEKYVTFTWDNQSEEIVFNSTPATDETGMTVFENERVKPIPEEEHADIGVGIYKHDKDTKEPVEDTVFGLYTRDDIYSTSGELIVPADTLLSEVSTDADGFAYFAADIPYMSEGYQAGSTGLNSGDYYIVEHAVPDGFFLDQTPLTVHFEYEDEYTPFIVVQAKQENISTSVDILKTDIKTMDPLAGATLQIIEQETGEVVHEFESMDEAVNIRRLKLSTQEKENIYILREVQPAAGYVTAADIPFKLIQATDENGELIMKADIYVLEDKNARRIQTGMIKASLEGKDSAVTYVTWELANGRLTLYVNEEIDAAVLNQAVKEHDFAGLSFNEVYFAQGKLEGFYEELVVKENLLTAILDFFTPDPKEAEPELTWVKAADETVVMEDDFTKVYISKYDIADGKPVVGAKMVITDLEGNVVEQWTTTEEEHYIEKLPVGDYILKEIQAPAEDGYVKAEDIPFTVEDDGSIQKVKMADDYTKIDISKVDVAGEEIPGAHMVLKDADGNVVEEWVSTEEPHRIERIAPGEYTLVETVVPDTYVQAEEITFVIEETGEVQKAEMTDKYTRIEIAKLDAVTKEHLKGVTLAIVDEEGREVYSWVTDGSVHRIERIPHGNYKLVEKEAPEGYLKAEDIPFEITTEDVDHKITMLDEPAYGQIEIYKTGDVLKGYSTKSSDFGTVYEMEFEQEALAGVVFTVYDKDGTAVDTIITDQKGYGISKELMAGDYVVKETRTPAGLAATYEEYPVKIGYSEKTGIVNAVLEIENHALDVEINVYKVGEMVQEENGTFGYGEKPLEGVYFGIYTGEDIKAADGHLILPKDRLIGVIKSDAEGKATLKDAIVGGKYYYKELQTLPGFVLDETVHAFEVTLGNEPNTIFEVNKENPMLNLAKKNQVQLIKVDASDVTRRLAGVEFELYTADGTRIGIYRTDARGEINLSDLAYGEYYFVETKTLSGYQLIPGKIHFEVGDEKVVIQCKNSTIPKLGFEDGYLTLALGATVAASAAYVILLCIRARMKKKEQDNE